MLHSIVHVVNTTGTDELVRVKVSINKCVSRLAPGDTKRRRDSFRQVVAFCEFSPNAKIHGMQ